LYHSIVTSILNCNNFSSISISFFLISFLSTETIFLLLSSSDNSGYTQFLNSLFLIILTSFSSLTSSFFQKNHQITQVSFFSIIIFLGLLGASSICNCFGCFAFANDSFSSFNFFIISSSSCLFLSSLSSFFVLFIFSVFLLNHSHIKVSFISEILSGISNAFLAKFTGENLKSITSEVKNNRKKASAVAILHNKLSSKGYKLKVA